MNIQFKKEKKDQVIHAFKWCWDPIISRNLWTFPEVYIPLPKAFPWIISCRVQWIEQCDLKFGGRRFEYIGASREVSSRQENGHNPHTFSAPEDQVLTTAFTWVTSPQVCIWAAPGLRMTNASRAGTCSTRLAAILPQAHGPGEGRLLGSYFLSHKAGRLPVYESQELKGSSQMYFSKQWSQMLFPVVTSNGQESWRK